MNQKLILVIALSLVASTITFLESSQQAKAKHTTTVCVDGQPCSTHVWNSTDSAQNSQQTSNMKSVCINERPCSTIIDETSN
jgi:hypothetical protein